MHEIMIPHTVNWLGTGIRKKTQPEVSIKNNKNNKNDNT